MRLMGNSKYHDEYTVSRRILLGNTITNDKKAKAPEETILLGLKERALLSQAQQRAEIAEEEAAALRQQHLILKDICEKEREQFAAIKEQNELLQNQLNQHSGIEKAKEKQNQEHEKLLQQKDKRILELQKQIETTNRQLSIKPPPPTFDSIASLKDREASSAIKEENALLTKSLTESQQHSRQLERVIQFLRERAEEAHLEAKQLREEFQIGRENVNKLTDRIRSLEEQERQLNTTLQEHELRQIEICKLQEALQTMKNHSDEKDQELKMAQQHFARKVKEVSILTSKNEEQRTQIIEFQQAITDAQGKVTTLQNSLDVQLKAEKQIQDQLNERLQAAEGQVRKWEEKYFHIHGKNQELEQECRHLKNLEQKQKQAYMMLTNLSLLLEAPKSSPEVVTKVVSAPPPVAPAQTDSEQNLFERPAQSSRLKKSLFD